MRQPLQPGFDRQTFGFFFSVKIDAECFDASHTFARTPARFPAFVFFAESDVDDALNADDFAAVRHFALGKFAAADFWIVARQLPVKFLGGSFGGTFAAEIFVFEKLGKPFAAPLKSHPKTVSSIFIIFYSRNPFGHKDS